MARWLRQSTSTDVPIGPFVDQTDGFSPESALTLTQPDIRLKKNGAAWAQKNAAQTLTHEENGYYEVTLDATDTNTLGLLRLAVNETGALPIFEDFLVVPANVYDSLFSTDLLQVDITQWLGSAPNALQSGLVQSNIQSVAPATINNAAFAADTGFKAIRSGTCTGGANNSITLDVSASSTNDFYKGMRIVLTAGVGALQARLCTAYNGTTKVATTEPDWLVNPQSGATSFAILVDTLVSSIGTAGLSAASFAAGAINAAATASDFLAEINAEVDTALADYDAPTFAELDARTDAIEAGTQDIQARIPAALVGGRIDARVGAFAAGVIDNAAMAADTNIYHAKVWVGKNGATSDIYVVTFYKNTVVLETGITSPLIDYVKKHDGTILVNDASLTEQGNGDYFYEESTNKIAAGSAYMVRVTATIDGSTRIMKQPVLRDST